MSTNDDEEITSIEDLRVETGGGQAGQQPGMGDSLSDEQKQQLIAAYMPMAQQEIVDNMDQMLSTVRHRRQSQWTGDEEARETFERVETGGDYSEPLDDAMMEFMERFNTILVYFLQLGNDPTAVENLKTELSELFIKFHDPGYREAMLLAIREEERDDFRRIFNELGMAIWGVRSMLAQENDENLWFLCQTIGAIQGVTTEEIARQAQGVSVNDVPPEYRQEE